MKQMFLTTGKDLDFLGIKWCPTKACNYHCSYCVQKNDDKKEINKDVIFDSLNKIDYLFSTGKLKWWKIIGGEFTILPLDVRDRILEIVNKYKPYLFLHTNGLNIEWLEPFYYTDGNLNISFHETEHDPFDIIKRTSQFVNTHPNFYLKYFIVGYNNLDLLKKLKFLLDDKINIQFLRDRGKGIPDWYKETKEYEYIHENILKSVGVYNKVFEKNKDIFKCTMRGITIDENGIIKLCNNEEKSEFTIDEIVKKLPYSKMCNVKYCPACNGQIIDYE